MEAVLYFIAGTVAGVVLGPRVRPLLLDATAAGYRVADAVSSTAAEEWKGIEGFARSQWKGAEGFARSQWKQVEDFFAEARARARQTPSLPPPEERLIQIPPEAH